MGFFGFVRIPASWRGPLRPPRPAAWGGGQPHLAGNIMHRAETAILMREHGVRRIYTRDPDFHRFPFLEVIDPAV